MAEVNFAQNAPSLASAPVPALEVQATVTQVTPAPAPVPTAAVPPVAPVPTPAPVPQVSVPATTSPSAVLSPRGLVLGDKLPDFEDVMWPRLNIVQSLGELKDAFEPGSVVHNKMTLLFKPAYINASNPALNRQGLPPINIIVLGFRPTRYVEFIEGGVGRSQIVNTEAEVKAAGGTLNYQEWELKKAQGMKRFQELAEALVAIERPETCADDDSTFVYPVDGKKYALALWAMKGTVFTEAAKKVFFMNRLAGCLVQGYPTRVFSMTTKWKPGKGNNGSWVPVLLPIAKTTPTMLEWVRCVLQAPPAEDSAAAAAQA